MSGRGTDFFISHAGRDTGWAEWLAWQLQQSGYTVEHDPGCRHLVLDTTCYLQAHGDSSVSRAVGGPLLDRWRSVLGPDHPDTLTAASTLTLALIWAGEVGSARALGQDTLQRCQSTAVSVPSLPGTWTLPRARPPRPYI